MEGVHIYMFVMVKLLPITYAQMTQLDVFVSPIVCRFRRDWLTTAALYEHIYARLYEAKSPKLV
jgi:hypothetical protein